MIPVCVFAKAPVAGKVKTRLIRMLGGEVAAELATAMFQDVWAVVSGCADTRPVLATVFESSFPVAIEADNIWLQGDGDLGMRIEKILRQGLRCAAGAIAVGADSPALTAEHLQAAIRGLEEHDAVIGRTIDGGFYLLGLRMCTEGLLAQLPWSTHETAEATARQIRAKGLTIYELPLLFDIDTPNDLETLVEYLRTNPEAAPATRAWCVKHRILEAFA